MTEQEKYIVDLILSKTKKFTDIEDVKLIKEIVEQAITDKGEACERAYTCTTEDFDNYSIPRKVFTETRLAIRNAPPQIKENKL